MAFINWKDELYSVGIDHIDDQHKKLVGMINDLYDAIQSKKKNAIIHDVLFELVDYTKYHFSSEEEFQEKINYPDLARHKLLHRDLVSKIVDILKKLKKGQDVSAHELLAFLKSWLIEHIVEEDKKIKKVLQIHKTVTMHGK